MMPFRHAFIAQGRFWCVKISASRNMPTARDNAEERLARVERVLATLRERERVNKTARQAKAKIGSRPKRAKKIR